MMRKQPFILALILLLSCCLPAVGQEAEKPEQSEKKENKEKKSASHIFTGFSGGMMLHGGYLFSQSPDQVFSNTGLGSLDYVKGLPRDGFCYGLGGALRCHLINHIHLGAEGFVSTMPLMKTGSNVRTGWGGVCCDFYTNWGKVRPLVGMTIGGGAMRRLFVPQQDPGVDYALTDSTNYNASFVKTPFFFMDPYVGLEIGISNHMAVIVRIDYMLPFGTTSSRLTDNVKWSNFMTPSGPRLYVGVMFGRLKRD